MALNGQFPSTMLAHLGWPEADHLQLVPGAAASITRLAAKFEAAFSKPLYLTDAYRTLATQKALKVSKGKFAATPGTSNHGLGLAIDMASRINVDGSAEHLWMSVHGPSFGWINPYWAVDYNPLNGQHEPWHWEYDYRLDRSTFAQAAPIAAPTPTTEDDMSAAGEAAILAGLSNIEGILATEGNGGIRGDVQAAAAASAVTGKALLNLGQNIENLLARNSTSGNGIRGDVLALRADFRALALTLSHPIT